MSECFVSGRGQGHASNFYIVDLENFGTASHLVYRWYTQLDRRRFVCDTYKTMKATWMRHGWVHMFITHRPTLTIQLLNFDLFRTCRKSSFSIVAWQLARFQLTQRITRFLRFSAIAELLVKIGLYCYFFWTEQQQSQMGDVPVLPPRTTNLMVYQSNPGVASTAGKVISATPVSTGYILSLLSVPFCTFLSCTE